MCRINKILVFVLFYILLTGQSSPAKSEDKGKTIRNPFLSPLLKIREERLKEERTRAKEKGEEKEEVSEEKEKGLTLELSGVIEGTQRLAIINDEIIGEGDIIEGLQVVEISTEEVTLKNSEQKIILKLE